MFCPGHPGLTSFTDYPGITQNGSWERWINYFDKVEVYCHCKLVPQLFVSHTHLLGLLYVGIHLYVEIIIIIIIILLYSIQHWMSAQSLDTHPLLSAGSITTVWVRYCIVKKTLVVKNFSKWHSFNLSLFLQFVSDDHMWSIESTTQNRRCKIVKPLPYLKTQRNFIILRWIFVRAVTTCCNGFVLGLGWSSESLEARRVSKLQNMKLSSFEAS